jgi:L-aspartate oxidase
MKNFDVVIVGSGLAGLSVALHLAQTRKVAIISKRELLDGASNWLRAALPPCWIRMTVMISIFQTH